jgi:hypothetical protein
MAGSIFSAGPGKEMLSVALYHLAETILADVELNAELGYQIDPRLPSPEVFERPGWRVLWVEGSVLEVARMPDLSIWSQLETEHVPSTPVPFDRYQIRPSRYVDVSEPAGIRSYGLGFDVEQRTWVVFAPRGSRTP